MPGPLRLKRAMLLGLSLLSACAAGGAGGLSGPQSEASSTFGAYLIGRFAQDSDDMAVAATNLLRALAASPNDPALLNQAFVAALLAQRPEANALAARLPDNPIAQLMLANEQARAGNWAQARRGFASLSSPGLSQYVSPLLTAWAQAGSADTDGALATLQPKLSTPPLAALSALHAAMIADLGNRFPQAQRLYAQAAAGYGGTNLRLAQIVANWQFRQGHVDDATQTLQMLGHSAPGLAIVVPNLIADMRRRPVGSALQGLAEVYLSFAAELQQQHGGDTSLALLRLALDLRPDLTAARLLMADALASNRHPGNALKVLAAVPAGDPLMPLVRLRRAGLQASQGDIAAAQAILQGLASQMPDRPEPQAALAELQRAQNKLPQAIASYTAALSRPAGAQSWSLYFARAAAEQQGNDWPAAEADLKQALRLSPDQPEVLNFLGYAWADRNEHLNEARAMLDRAIKLRPNDGAIIDSLGWIMLRQGDIPGAVHSLEKAAQLDPVDPEIAGHLGDAYWAAGRKLQARYQWQLALNLKPPANTIAALQAKLQDAEKATGGRD